MCFMNKPFQWLRELLEAERKKFLENDRKTAPEIRDRFKTKHEKLKDQMKNKLEEKQKKLQDKEKKEGSQKVNLNKNIAKYRGHGV